MRGRISLTLGLTLVTGCDLVFGLAPTASDASTSPPDAITLGCATRTPTPLLCADFEDTPPLWFGHQPFDLPVPSPGAMASIIDTLSSHGHALKVESLGSTYVIRNARGPSFTGFDASLRVRFDRTDAAYPQTAILHLAAAAPPGLTSCYVDLQVLTTGAAPELQLVSYCGPYDHAQVLAVLSPSGWIDLAVAVDYAQHVATATIDGVHSMVTLDSTFTAATNAEVHLGIEAGGANPGLAISYDDVVITPR